jgi:hypothetical protein
LVPETLVLPIAVSGVISRTAHRHRIAQCFADPREREWAAATLQVLLRHLRDTQTRVVIGEPVMLERFGQRAAIRTAMASLLMQGKSRLDESLTTSGPAIGPVVGTLFP